MKDLLMAYYQKRSALNNRDYLINLLAYHLSPVIASDKPATLFTLRNRAKNDVLACWEQEKNHIFFSTKINYHQFGSCTDRISLFLYDDDRVRKLLRQPDIRSFLQKKGYQDLGIRPVFKELSTKFEQGFPHEIGLLLGIPLRDVIQFIEKPGCQPLARGYWKVYQDLEGALQTFASYNAAKITYMKYILNEQSADRYLIENLQCYNR